MYSQGENMKKLTLICLIIIIMLMLIACAPGPNTMKKTEGPGGKVAGFWKGLWHGIITPVAFVISLFNKNINIYEVHNNGGWYNLGYILGLMIIFSGSGTGAGRVSCSRKRD
jgi:hypothetical protein